LSSSSISSYEIDQLCPRYVQSQTNWFSYIEAPLNLS
jgi:hypothetical protein